MKTYTGLTNLFTTLVQNTSPTITALGQQLINDQHRYLIQRYFDNERTYQTSTVGTQNLTLTAGPASGATSATLTAAWTYQTVTQLVNFNNGDQRSVLFTNGSAAISWPVGLSSSITTAVTPTSIATQGVQRYAIPANISKIKDNTITVGQLRFVPYPQQTRVEWDQQNTLPYQSDIPAYFFIWNGAVEFWPIPASTGNIITMNYKSRVQDFWFTDYTTGTITGWANGAINVTGSGTAWNTGAGLPLNTDLSWHNIYIKVTQPGGDGIWYPVSQITSDTALVLGVPIQNSGISGSTTYVLGQLPVLQEDFHDMLVYGALKVYYSSVVENEEKYKEFTALFESRMTLLEEYAGTKQVDVNLGARPQYRNPNLYTYATTSQ